MVGDARRLAHRAIVPGLVVLLLAGSFAIADSMYKYRGPDGEWIYADRPPDDDTLVEVRQVEGEEAADVGIAVTYEFTGNAVDLIAQNPSYVPIELEVKFTEILGLEYPHPDDPLRWLIPARTNVVLLSLDLLENGRAPSLEYQYRHLAGDPQAQHRPEQSYRAPFAISTSHSITQAFPQVATHTTRDSHYAVDVAMPVGTDIMAARGGIVFDIAASNFAGGLDPERDGPNANVVRILHDDGTYAIYAHLNTNTIRVRPGDRVERGEYIADSGNTGFSSGPHLHFAVVRNAGMRIESVPVMFSGRNAEKIVPAAGADLTAY